VATQIDLDQDYILIKGFSQRIADRIFFTWGYCECEKYLHNLMIDTRDGERQGFPSEIAAAIISLQAKHQKEFDFGGACSWDAAGVF
jgi:hypothetical protein